MNLPAIPVGSLGGEGFWGRGGFRAFFFFLPFLGGLVRAEGLVFFLARFCFDSESWSFE